MIVLDFSQYLAGPSAALRLADMGARVIKIERPGSGDGSRQMKLHNLDSMGDSVLFQTINRNKQSFCADLKSPEDMNMVKKLIRRSVTVKMYLFLTFRTLCYSAFSRHMIRLHYFRRRLI